MNRFSTRKQPVVEHDGKLFPETVEQYPELFQKVLVRHIIETTDTSSRF